MRQKWYDTYYNEFDPYPAEWLTNLAGAGLITGGVVDERSIKEVRAEDLSRYNRAHFFAGIGGWDYALQLAGWPARAPVWTGSCPCQPFSQAGQGKGIEDERHLWPEFLRLIAERMPPVIFGEQVASKDGRLWLDGVRADLEVLGYEVGAADLCAAGINAPHIRQRLWWVAYTDKSEQYSGGRSRGSRRKASEGHHISRSSSAGRLGHSCEQPCKWKSGEFSKKERKGKCPRKQDGGCFDRHTDASKDSFWGEFDIAWCFDPRDSERLIPRRIEPGTFPLAHGIPGRVGQIRAYGNAIVPQVAAEFIKASMEALHIN